MEDMVASWHQRRITRLEAGLDWSRCFMSVLFADSEDSRLYMRARVAQRLLDAVSEWNGVGKVVEVYACTAAPGVSNDDDEDSPGFGPTQAAGLLADRVGLDQDHRGQLLRKLGAGWAAPVHQEDLREHGVVVALDRDACARTGAHMRAQGLDPDGGSLLLFSDLVWYFEANRPAIEAARCLDGSGCAFLDDASDRALRRLSFEVQSEACFRENAADLAPSASAPGRTALDAPAWPGGGLELEPPAATPGEWRRLYGHLLKGSLGLAWLLLGSWQRSYANPLTD